MNLKQLNYFTTIVEFKNMTRASEKLHVAQPALSQQVRLLESELNVKLLHRNVHGVSPTREGELLYRHARSILRQIDNTHALLVKKDGPINGKVSIGMPSSTGRAVALPLLQRTMRLYPGITIEIVDVPSADLTALVAQGRVDMAITPNEQPRRGISMQPVLTEELFLIISPDMQISSIPVSVEELANIPLILPSKPNTLRASVDQLFLEKQLSYVLVAEASTSAILIPAVKAGLAATVLPWSAVREEVNSGALSSVRLASPTVRELSLCTADSLPFTEAARFVRELFFNIVDEMIKNGEWLGAHMINREKS